MRAVAYLRVSSLSQVEGHSLDAQERLFREFCKSRGWEAVRVYREEGRSAHTDAIARRPVFRQLLEDATRGLFDVVVVHTLDRWSRNLRVTLETLGHLARQDVSLVSITENLDYSTPMGRLATQMLGSFAEFFSDSLGTHIRKGQQQRAAEGRHLGGLPFGYASCQVKEGGERRKVCSPEHPGGVHLVEEEAQAVAHLFREYATGTTTLSQLAAWLNGQGFRTRNTKRLPDGAGGLAAGPRLFTVASVRTILHNPFYAGWVRHHGKLHPGAHEAIVGQELYDLVQDALRRNNGRSETLTPHPERHYLLKGLIRCAWCGYPMWAQTYANGRRYYREQHGSRGEGACAARSGSIPCEVPDEQVGRVVQAVTLEEGWLERALARLSVADEVARVRQRREQVRERLRRLGTAYVDGLVEEEDYRRQKRALELELAALAVPEASAAEEAGRLLERLPELWAEATEEERRRLLLAMLDAVYVDTREERRVVAIKPKPAFRPVFLVATTREGSGVELIKDGPPHEEGAPTSPCWWWRRGRVELPVQKTLRGSRLQA